MRGHGNVVVGPDARIAVGRAIGMEANARLQPTAIQLGSPVTYFTADEGATADAINPGAYMRGWDLWKRKALGQIGVT
jgi:ribulose-5-phosphate 4-epimerase/fuculose-1-phosphate aldolase